MPVGPQDGQFAAAVQTATRAMKLALAAGQHEIATQVQSQLASTKPDARSVNDFGRS